MPPALPMDFSQLREHALRLQARLDTGGTVSETEYAQIFATFLHVDEQVLRNPTELPEEYTEGYVECAECSQTASTLDDLRGIEGELQAIQEEAQTFLDETELGQEEHEALEKLITRLEAANEKLAQAANNLE